MNQNSNITDGLFAKEILIDQDSDLKKECEFFIKELDLLYTDYKNNLDQLEKEWKIKFKNGNFPNVSFVPEKLAIKSPLTILDGAWGSGKTHFIETLATFFIEKDKKSEIDRKQFKNLVIVDAWYYLSSNNITESLIKELSKILHKFLEKTKITEIKNKINKIFKWSWKKRNSIAKFLIVTLAIFFNLSELTTSTLFWNATENKEEEEEDDDNFWEKEYKQIIKKIDANIKPTIIIFDNIERMGYQAIEIIKTIQKLSIFKKFLFLIPMNKNQLSFGHRNDLALNEAAIDKYITLGSYFVLKSNYAGMLKKIGINNEYINIIQSVLNENIRGYTLSIRQAENTFKNHKIVDAFSVNKYTGLGSLQKIWPAYKIKSIIEEDVNLLIKDLEELDNNFRENHKIGNHKIWEDFNLLRHQLLEFPGFEKLYSFIDFFINNFYLYSNDLLYDWINNFKIINYEIKLVEKSLKSVLNNLINSLEAKFDYLNNFGEYTDWNQVKNFDKAAFDLHIRQKNMLKNKENLEKLLNHSFWNWIEEHINNLIEKIEFFVNKYQSNFDKKIIYNLAKDVFPKIKPKDRRTSVLNFSYFKNAIENKLFEKFNISKN